LLVSRLAIMTTKDLIRSLLRKPTHGEYLRSCVRGIVMSCRFRVDRAHRLYQAA
jgi:hypothetical protein